MAKYSDETRAAVLAAIASGDSIRHAAEAHDVPPSTAAGWKKKAKVQTGSAQSRTKKRNGEFDAEVYDPADPFSDLLILLTRDKIQTLREQLHFFRDVEWLRKQNAADVAILFGVVSDKALRLLEAYGGAIDDEPTTHRLDP